MDYPRDLRGEMERVNLNTWLVGRSKSAYCRGDGDVPTVDQRPIACPAQLPEKTIESILIPWIRRSFIKISNTAGQ